MGIIGALLPLTLFSGEAETLDSYRYHAFHLEVKP
jgi:hypothetical protein